MRTIIAAVIALLTGIASAAWLQVGTGAGPAKVTVEAASALGATVTVEIPGIEAESVAINGTQYLKLAIPGAVSAGLDVGKPEVPAIPVLLARPTGSAVTLRVLSIQTETLQVGARVFPLQSPLGLGEQAAPATVDISAYTSDAEYPSDRLSSPRAATWRDLDVVNVHVYPVSVLPAQNEVVVTSRITFRADFSGGPYPATVASRMQPVYRSLIRNYDQLRLATTTQEPSGTKLLVVCHDEYLSNLALDSLCVLMTRLGDSTEVISVSDNALPVRIKDTIWNRYVSQDPPALRWVLLVGEYDEIPPREVTINGMGTVYSDVWYSDIDVRGPGYEDSCDGYPEIGVARLSPASGVIGNQDLSNQIAKIRAYTLGTYADTWVNKITLVAHKAPSPDSAVVGADTIDLQFFEGTRDTIRGRNQAVWNTNVKTAIDQGTGVLVYVGHGLDTCWGQQAQGDSGWNTHDQCWTNDTLNGLQNPDMTPVVFNIACQCGNLLTDTCLSEAWMRKYPGGAVASFGASGEINPSVANTQCYAAVRATRDTWTTLWSPDSGNEYVGPVFDLGGIQMLMDAYIATVHDSAAASNIYGCMWLGNPAMPVWSGGAPRVAEVSYSLHIPIGQDSFPFLVSVKTDNDQGYENARVCAYKPDPDGFYVVGLTDSTGEVTLNLTTSSVGTFYVSASEGHVAFSDHGTGILHTPMLPFLGESEVYDSTPEMTYPNWSRKLVRGSNANTLHVVYTGGGTVNDSVFYTQSTNAGTSWPIVERIGAGSCPSIVLNGQSATPWVVYLAPDSSIKRAIRQGDGSWDQATIFQGSPGDSVAGAPSLARSAIQDVNGLAYVTYPVVYSGEPDNNFVFFNAFTPSSIVPAETVDAAESTSCYGASIAVTPLSQLHFAWIRGQSVYYRRDSSSVWSASVPISSPTPPITEPVSNPSVEAYGDSFFCVWRGPNENGDSLYGDIWRRSRWLSYPVGIWSDAGNQSLSESLESDFPVMTTSFATVWQEQVSQDNFDIWGKFLPDLESRSLFQSEDLLSCYPHVDGYWPIPVPTATFRCNTVWTQQTDSNPPQYALWSGSHDYIPSLHKGLGPDPRKDYEPALYYAAELGQPKQSPYCVSRGGFAQFETWSTDTSALGLTYQLPYLDPHRAYRLCAVLYHEGEGTWKADMRCDSGPWINVKVTPRIPDTVWMQVPRRSYNDDARIVVELSRVTGGYVSLAKLKLFQIEEEPGEDGGVQSLGSDRTFVTRLRGFSPNPFAKGTSVNYELAQYGPVELTVHDVSGRLVTRLESGPRQRGIHAVRWNATDGRGHAVPAGVYFVRLSAGGRVCTGRLTLVR